MGDKLLLIGMAPSRTGDPCRVLEGRTGVWLVDLMGLDLGEYLRLTDRVNLFDSWQGRREGKGDLWPAREAAVRASGMLPLLVGRSVVLIGRCVAVSFGLPRMEWLTWTEVLGARLAVVPHPSGIVTWWNNRANVERAGAFLRDAVICRRLP